LLKTENRKLKTVMFIPKGKAIYENLATSYVLVDALVMDLCEGGFSGVVEVTLQQSTGYVIFEGGTVAAVTEKHGDKEYTKISVAELAAKARGERGRVSVYGYSEPVARALSSLLHAEPLYTKLSSDFADLQKMVVKFMREGDRHWFIEVQTETTTSLVFIHQGKCVVVTPTLISSDGSPEKLETVNRLALQELIDRCSRSGAIFDVYFRNPNDAIAIDATPDEAEPPIPEIIEPPPDMEVTEAVVESPNLMEMMETVTAKATEEPEWHAPLQTDDVLDLFDTEEHPPMVIESEEEPKEAVANDSITDDASTDAVLVSTTESPEEEKVAPEILAPPSPPPPTGQTENGHPGRVLQTRELMAMAGTDNQAVEDFRMAEVKGLLSDIARSIEEITRIVEQRDDFPMHLRAGQLKVADQYPFLDPFGSDFEYLEGEIVFVGKAALHEFIVGVTEALRFAVTNAVQSSINPPRLRSEIIRKLKFQYERNREEFHLHGLDLSIEQIAGVQITGAL
jgi:hypothetical protein